MSRPVFVRALRAALPDGLRRWLFDPSMAELADEAASRQHGGRTSRVRIVGLWLHCWLIGLRAALRAVMAFLRPGRRATRLPTASPDSESFMQSVLQDVRYSFRALRASGGFAAIAILTLALGIGVNTAIFTIVDMMMFRPMPGVQNSDELAFVMARDGDTPFFMNLTYPNYEDLRAADTGFADLLAYSWRVVGLGTAGSAAERAFAQVVSANYFGLQGVAISPGRDFTPEEGLVDVPAPVLMLAHNYWQTRFGGDPEVVGSTIELNGIPFTVVGVASPEYVGIESMLAIQIYIPTGALPALSPTATGALRSRTGSHFRVMGRLAEGASLPQVQEAVDVVAGQLRADFPEANGDQQLTLIGERAARPDPSAGGQFAQIAVIFGVLVGMVLLIACANVANLMLARATSRDSEVAVRSALGAGRWRIVRQIAIESMMLGLGGAVLGILLAVWATETLRGVVASWQIGMSLQLPLQTDLRAVVFGTAVAVLASLIAGIVPALQITGGDLTLGLRQGSRSVSAGGSRQRLRGALVIAQVAVSLILIVAAGLFLRSLSSVRDAGLGFETEGRLYVSIDPGVVGYERTRGLALQEELLAGTLALPGVRAAGLVNSTPFGSGTGFTGTLPEREAAGDEEPGTMTVRWQVSPGYLDAIGTRLLRGRDVAVSDSEDMPAVAIVNELMAENMWPGEDAIGKRFVTPASGTVYEVIGVAEQGKYMLIWEEPTMAFYEPTTQRYQSTPTLVLHAEGDPLALAEPVRQLLQRLAPTVPVFDVMTAEANLRDGRGLMLIRLATGLVGAFGVLGLTLATIGLYGVVAYAVGQRLREFGVRIALGADTGSVLRLVVRHGLLMSGVGVAVGATLALGVGRMMSTLLIGVSPADPLVFGVAIVTVVATAAAASLIPAWRATRVDPVNALRGQ